MDWKDRVNGVLDEIKKALGKNAQWFATKVEEKFAPNYYSVIARPMWFNLVKDNVRKAYVHPQQAYDDLKQVRMRPPWRSVVPYAWYIFFCTQRLGGKRSSERLVGPTI